MITKAKFILIVYTYMKYSKLCEFSNLVLDLVEVVMM